MPWRSRCFARRRTRRRRPATRRTRSSASGGRGSSASRQGRCAARAGARQGGHRGCRRRSRSRHCPRRGARRPTLGGPVHPGDPEEHLRKVGCADALETCPEPDHPERQSHPSRAPGCLGPKDVRLLVHPGERWSLDPVADVPQEAGGIAGGTSEREGDAEWFCRSVRVIECVADRGEQQVLREVRHAAAGHRLVGTPDAEGDRQDRRPGHREME